MKNGHPVVRATSATCPSDSQGTSTGSATSSEPTEPIIRLKLDKPLHWEWQLTTSADPLPVIQLLDKDGRLLVETTGRTAQKARGSFRDGIKSYEEFSLPETSLVSSSVAASSPVASPPLVTVPQGNRNMDGFSSKFGTCEFGYVPRKSRSEVGLGRRETIGKEVEKKGSEAGRGRKRHSTGPLERAGSRDDRCASLNRYSAGDYLRQQILNDIRTRSTLGKTDEEVAKDRYKKVKAYLGSRSDCLPAGISNEEMSLSREDRAIGGTNGEQRERRFRRSKSYSRSKVDSPWPENNENCTVVEEEESRRSRQSKHYSRSRSRIDFEGVERKECFKAEDVETSARQTKNYPRFTSKIASPRAEKEERCSFKDVVVDGERRTVSPEDLEKIRAFLRERLRLKMNSEYARSGSLSRVPEFGRVSPPPPPPPPPPPLGQGHASEPRYYRARKARSESNVMGLERERLEKSSGLDPMGSPSRDQRRVSWKTAKVAQQKPRDSADREDDLQQKLRVKRTSSSLDRRKLYRKTKSDVLLGRIGSEDPRELEGNPPRRIKSQDNMERSWREYKERKKHERLHRETDKDVEPTEEDFMSKARWKDLQSEFCPTRNCKVCRNSMDCEREASKCHEQMENSKTLVESTDERPGTSLQENYLLIDSLDSRRMPSPNAKSKSSEVAIESTSKDSLDCGYNSIPKSAFRDYRELYARSNVKKSDTFKIVDGTENLEEASDRSDHETLLLEQTEDKEGLCEGSLANKSNEDIAKDYFKRVYELLKKRQMEARELASGSKLRRFDDSSSSNYVEDTERRQRQRRRRKEKSPPGERIVAVPPGGGQESWKAQPSDRRRACRPQPTEAVPLGKRNRPPPPPPPPPTTTTTTTTTTTGTPEPTPTLPPPPPPPPPPTISSKINVKDIGKYFDQPTRQQGLRSNGLNPEKKAALGEPKKEEETDIETEMGSNLSRHNGKGLTGRRTQSSGNLCDPKRKLNTVGRMLVPCSSAQRERYKFCGSLPNHLDDKDMEDSRENNNVSSDAISGNLGGTLPHKKRSLGVHFSDGGPTGTLDLVKHRSQDSLDENDPWRYQQSDLDLVRCRHGNFDSVRRNRNIETQPDEPNDRRYRYQRGPARGASLENHCHRNVDLDLVGTLPKRRQDSRNSGKSFETTTFSSSQPCCTLERDDALEDDVDEVDDANRQNDDEDDILMGVVHKPDCELLKHRQLRLNKCPDLKLGKVAGVGEPQDQGYASERSPEDEHPPALPGQSFPSVTPESTFRVTLQKSSRGLGLSLSGGGTAGPVRVKRLFPQQPAALSNKLQSGDILLAANGTPLTGLTNYEALEVLRTTPSTVELVVCRVPGDANVTPPGAPPPPPARREPPRPPPPPPLRILNPLPPLQIEPGGEFDIEMTKVGGSLGFTLRKADSSALGHYVRALVREPALSDGRIRPGDKIVAVDGAPLSPMSHEEAVALLRQCGPKVKLRLYRDLAQTPVSALSPTEPDHPLRPPRTSLRQEAVDMLCDLAVRKLSPGTSSGSSCKQSSATSCNSPRRLRRLATRTPTAENEQDIAERHEEPQAASISSQADTTASSDLCSIATRITNSQAGTPDADIIDPPSLYDASTSPTDSSRPSAAARPSFLDLSAPQGKPHFHFCSQDSDGDYQSIGGDESSDFTKPEIFVESVTSIGDVRRNEEEQENELPSEPASMPPMLLSSVGTASTGSAFSYKNPAYQSANPACGAGTGSAGHGGGHGSHTNGTGMEVGAKNKGTTHSSDQDIPGKVLGAQDPIGSKGLLKWKGVMFAPNDQEKLSTSVEGDNAGADVTDASGILPDDLKEGDEVFMVELTRGWNSRLGFSLQPEGDRTVISVVHPDSVAAKDGRLKQGDVLVMVNDESVESMATTEIIDLLRKIRGSIGITVMRRCKREGTT